MVCFKHVSVDALLTLETDDHHEAAELLKELVDNPKLWRELAYRG